MQIDLNRYRDFVKEVTSEPSNELTSFMNRLEELQVNWNDKDGIHESQINVPLLLTAALGLSAETGEFCEIPKKIYFQGKTLNEDSIFHMKRELGDIMWYWINACRSLNLDPNDVINENVNKLMSRYPGGVFDVHYSENRKDNDI